MRVLLRQQATGLYLQPAGRWDPNRETAREFVNAAVAYSWAVESRIIHSEVVLAFIEPQSEFVCMRVDTDANRPIINCQDMEWMLALFSILDSGMEADLIDFDKGLHGESCKLLARAFELNFSLDRDTQARTAHFRKGADCSLAYVQA